MSSCLGVYVDKNLIKYAKLKRIKDSFKIEAFNVEVFEDLETSLKKIINETGSNKCPICMNISNELYNYFDVFSGKKHFGGDYMNYQQKRKRKMMIVRVVAIICAVLIIGSVVTAALFTM